MRKRRSRQPKLDILATKKDLAELKVDIIKWNTGTLLAATGIFALIVKLLA